MLMNPSLTTVLQERLAAHRRLPRTRPSPQGGQEFGNNAPAGGGLIYPWWWWGSYFPYMPYSYSYYAPYYGTYLAPSPSYPERYFDGINYWTWNGVQWVLYFP
jgi:hypothetical protein